MDPISLQRQLRDNSTELQEYYNDIQSWGEEMKRKEAALKDNSEDCNVPLPRNKSLKKEHKTSAPLPDPPAKKISKDFSFWENYDADAECSKLDKTNSTDDSDLTDEFDEDAIDMAQQEKEKGNKFVKSQCWEDAIKSYSSAISLYSYDATFYANRALCHLKLEQYKSAEADCTIAINLDKNYVKAMHRRALAKKGLKQLKEAKEDLEMVLNLEPENKESQKLLDNIDKQLNSNISKNKTSEICLQRPVSKFTASRGMQKDVLPSTSATREYDLEPAFKEIIVEKKKPKSKVITLAGISKPSFQWPAGDDVLIVKAIKKLPKEQSRMSLKHIQVKETTLLFK